MQEVYRARSWGQLREVTREEPRDGWRRDWALSWAPRKPLAAPPSVGNWECPVTCPM